MTVLSASPASLAAAVHPWLAVELVAAATQGPLLSVLALRVARGPGAQLAWWCALQPSPAGLGQRSTCGAPAGEGSGGGLGKPMNVGGKTARVAWVAAAELGGAAGRECPALHGGVPRPRPEQHGRLIAQLPLSLACGCFAANPPGRCKTDILCLERP